MGSIRLLEESLIAKIAAGEVVENPASIVKELLENSIDAGARRVYIALRYGGRQTIEVIDDGVGMDMDDAKMSVQRHATSKIQNANDLNNIKTLGFRGEALASIAAVSKLTIKTKKHDSLIGTELFVEGGKLNYAKESACPNGTLVRVEELFYNVPARQKFLKPPEKELKKVVDIVSQQALIYPLIEFKLSNDGITLLDCHATSDWLARLASIFNRKIVKEVVAVNYADSAVQVVGFISKPQFDRGDKSRQITYVNSRCINSKLLNDAIYEGFKGYLGVGRHPQAILNIMVPVGNVDVNVHPNKKEVRFSNQQDVETAVIRAIRDALTQESTVPIIQKPTYQHNLINATSISTEMQEILWNKPNIGVSTISNYPEETVRPNYETEGIRILGQVAKTYIIAEKDRGIIIIDQHAAQERVLYEKFLEQYRKKNVAMQALLEPIVFEASASESISLQLSKNLLEQFGFYVEEFGKNTFLLRKIPTMFSGSAVSKIFSDIVNSLSAKKHIEAKEEENIIRKSCRTAVKANCQLEVHEMRSLLTELFQSKEPYTCPHGRPTMISYPLEELEKIFKRKGF
ncbi:MAG: DNA mismatch repair endonuclease MutL [Candidatus Woesearchaeota archaeon]